MLSIRLVPLALVPLTLAGRSAAQADLEWDRNLQLAAPERLAGGTAQPDGSGGSLVTGSRTTYFAIPGEPGHWIGRAPILMHFDAAGVQLSTQDLAPYGTNGGLPILVGDGAGGCVLGGAPGGHDVTRLDASGATLWSTPAPVAVEAISRIGLTSTGLVRVGGFRLNSGPSMTALGLDAAGAIQFTQTTPSASTSGCIAAVAADGRIALATASNFSAAGAVFVYQPDGTLAWSAPIATNRAIEAVAFTPSGGIVLAGELGYPTMSGAHVQVQAFDASGASPWTYTEAGLALSRVRDVAVSQDGLVAVVGDGYGVIPGGQSGLAILLDTSGVQRWKNSWFGVAAGNGSWLQAVRFRASGEVVAAGTANLTATAPYDYHALQGAPAIACFARDGAVAWQYVGASLHNTEECTGLIEQPNGSFVFATASRQYEFTTFEPAGGRLLSVRPRETSYCFGDGSATACPCGNASPVGAGAGCAHSLGGAGRLDTSGVASLAADTLVLRGSGMTSSGVLYFQGTTRQGGGAGAPFGDGLRCAAGAVRRLGTKTNVGGASQLPTGADAAIHVSGAIAAPGVRTYQAWYRNTAAFCTASPFNLTNGLEVTWGP